MKNVKRIISLVLTICIVASALIFMEPVETEAATTIEMGAGTVTVTALENDYKDGYRINYKFTLKSNWSSNSGLKITNIRLENSSGKKMCSWKDMTILKESGTATQHFRCDFSTYPTDTYVFKFTISDDYTYKKQSFSRKISHTAGSVSYSSSKYITDTYGKRKLQVVFACKMVNGNCPKLEVYDSKNKLVYSYNTKTAIKGTNITYTCTWDMTNSKTGMPVPSGTYTFKFTCRGLTATKKLNITVK